MTEKVEAQKELKEKPKPKSLWSVEEKKLMGERYGCQLITEACDNDQVNERQCPTDTMIVSYKVEGKVYRDLCRGSQVNIFDLYYDKFGKDGIQKIDYGHGTINPGQWGYKAPERKKRRKG